MNYSIGDYVSNELICKYSHNFFDKLVIGCYTETIVIIFICSLIFFFGVGLIIYFNN